MLPRLFQFNRPNEEDEEEIEDNKHNSLVVVEDDSVNDSSNGLSVALPSIILNIFGNKKKAPPSNLARLTPDENSLLKSLKLTFFEKKKLLSMWNELIGKSRVLNFNNFLSYFHLVNENWIKRLFDIINNSLSGNISLSEFLSFVRKYLVVDIDGAEEV